MQGTASSPKPGHVSCSSGRGVKAEGLPCPIDITGVTTHREGNTSAELGESLGRRLEPDAT